MKTPEISTIEGHLREVVEAERADALR